MSAPLDIGALVSDPERLLLALDRVDYEDSLYLFLKAAWRQIDPSPFIDGWSAEAICEHLQAVVDGDIRRLLINLPPRCLKSSLCSVALPAWTWIQRENSPTSGPGVPFLHASYAYPLSVRDSVKCRRLIESAWYQSLWNGRFVLTGDQNTKTRFSNDKGGERLITSIGSGVTGEGGQIIVIDDPNAANEAFSEATIQSTIDWWDGTMSTRLNDAKTGAYIIIQQRLAEDDLTGHVLSKDIGEWTHLMLPMSYEADRSTTTSIGWTDPRTIEGELLWPERFGIDEVKALERSLGPFGASGQLQQRPEPKGGGIIKRDWWINWTEEAFPPMDYILASVDGAFTEKEENDPCAMTIWGVFTTDPVATASRVIDKDGRPQYMDRVYAEQAPKVMLMTAWREWLQFHELVEKVATTAKKLKVDCILIENKASGISLGQEIRRIYNHEPFSVQFFDPKSQDKTARLYSVQPLFAPELDRLDQTKIKRPGIVYAPDRSWADMVITEVSQAPKGKYRDLTDTTSQALIHLRNMGLLTLPPERLADIELLKQYTGRTDAPLYPA